MDDTSNSSNAKRSKLVDIVYWTRTIYIFICRRGMMHSPCETLCGFRDSCIEKYLKLNIHEVNPIARRFRDIPSFLR